MSPEEYFKEILPPYASRTPVPDGVGGFQGPAAHCRRPQETSGEKERTRAGEDRQRWIESHRDEEKPILIGRSLANHKQYKRLVELERPRKWFIQIDRSW